MNGENDEYASRDGFNSADSVHETSGNEDLTKLCPNNDNEIEKNVSIIDEKSFMSNKRELLTFDENISDSEMKNGFHTFF